MDDKIIKFFKLSFLGLGIFEFIIFIFSLFSSAYFSVVVSGIYFLCLFFAYIFANEKMKVAGIIGIIISISLFFSIIWFDIIDFLFGIVLLVFSLKYIKMFKKENHNKNISSEEKIVNNLKNDFLVLAILESIMFVVSLLLGMFFVTVTSLIFAIVLFIGYSYARQKNKNAGMICLIVGILMMCTILFANIIDFLLGLFLILHASRYNKLFK